MGRSAAQRGLNPWTAVLYTFGIRGSFLLLSTCSAGRLSPAWRRRPRARRRLLLAGAGLGGLGRAVPAGGGAYPGRVRAVQRQPELPALQRGQPDPDPEPAFTAPIAYLLLGERLNGVQIAGSLMILGGGGLPEGVGGVGGRLWQRRGRLRPQGFSETLGVCFPRCRRKSPG